MSEWHLFLRIFRSTRGDVAVLLTTFLLTVLVDLTAAIQAGVVLASLLFILRMSRVTRVAYVTEELERAYNPSDDPMAIAQRRVPHGVQVFEIDGPFFFGAADRFRDALDEVGDKPKVLILRMRHVPVLDSTGLRGPGGCRAENTEGGGTAVVLSGVLQQPAEVLRRSGLEEELSTDNIVPHIEAALARASFLLEKQ